MTLECRLRYHKESKTARSLNEGLQVTVLDLKKI
jgi:hypothetical protein